MCWKNFSIYRNYLLLIFLTFGLKSACIRAQRATTTCFGLRTTSVQIETLRKASRNVHLGGEGVEKSGFEFEIQFCGKCNPSTPNRT